MQTEVPSLGHLIQTSPFNLADAKQALGAYQNILDWLQQRVAQGLFTQKRFEHSIGVAVTAGHLAQRYGFDPSLQQQVLIAGLVHDCAKTLPLEDMLALSENCNLPLLPEDKQSRQTLHAYAGAALAEQALGITDKSILLAICAHTTFWPAPSWQETLVYVADKTEPVLRDPVFIAKINTECLTSNDPQNLKLAAAFILEDTLRYLQESGQTVHPRSAQALKNLQDL